MKKEFKNCKNPLFRIVEFIPKNPLMQEILRRLIKKHGHTTFYKSTVLARSIKLIISDLNLD